MERDRRRPVGSRVGQLHAARRLEGHSRRWRALLEVVRPEPPRTARRSVGDAVGADEGLPVEPVSQRGEGARSRSARARRPAGTARAAVGRGSQADRAQLARAQRSRAGGADDRRHPERHRHAEAEDPRPLRPRADEHASRPRGAERHRERQQHSRAPEPRHPVPRARTAAARAGPRWPRSTARRPTST